jgi:hypothetical protein
MFVRATLPSHSQSRDRARTVRCALDVVSELKTNTGQRTRDRAGH